MQSPAWRGHPSCGVYWEGSEHVGYSTWTAAVCLGADSVVSLSWGRDSWLCLIWRPSPSKGTYLCGQPLCSLVYRAMCAPDSRACWGCGLFWWASLTPMGRSRTFTLTGMYHNQSAPVLHVLFHSFHTEQIIFIHCSGVTKGEK
jgi:hypothetical protein